MRRGFAATTSGHYGEAILLFQKGFDLSRSQGDPCTAAWFLNNIAGAHFRLFRYRQALAAYLEERPHALRCGDSTSQGSLALNISSLYARMENLEAAVAAADESLQYFSRNSNSPYRASALVNRARLYARERNPSAAIDTYLAGLEESRRHFDPSQPGRVREYVDLQVVGWTELGRVYLERREFDRAEHALLEAYRVQRVHRFSPTNTTYRDLAFLERARGDTPAALRLMDRAVAKGLAAPRAPLFLLLRDRG
ncbi:MAG TPA: hypothetical protein DEH78_10820, partial [Solibacterales bacterium]|nr:hypothetical protein [Bryobacterales bacterium]